MKKPLIARCALMLVLLFTSAMAFASPDGGIIVKGTVTDEAYKEPVTGAYVMVKGTTIGTMTDIDGNYSLEVPDENAVLVFSFIGYDDIEIPVGKKAVINAVMKTNALMLEEVVTIAYGNRDKRMLTSAVSTISNKELLKTPATSVTNMLAGSMPGVSSIQTSGQPGKDAAQIYVRGTGSLNSSLSSPLILVDGVERDFSQIDPNEIQSISVLKDASSTAVFGVRGANGVILVTTRRGSDGKARISVSSQNGIQQPINLVEQVGSYEYARFWNMKQQMDGVTNPKLYFTPEQVEAYRTGADPIMYPSINWQDYLFRKAFMQSQNNLNISGGNEKAKYFVSLGYTYQNGLLKQLPGQKYDNNYSYNRYNYRANLDLKLTNSTTMKVGIGGQIGKIQEPRNMVSGTGHDQNAWVMTQIWCTPFSSPGFVNGIRTGIPKELLPGPEMRDGINVFYGYGYDQTYRTTLNLDVDLTQNLDIITKGLSFSIKGAYDNNFSLFKSRTGGGIESQMVYYKSYLDHHGALPETDPEYDKTLVYVPSGADSPLNYSESNGRAQKWYLEARFNYERTFKEDHKVSALLLYNQSRDYYPKQYTYIPRSYLGFVGRAAYSYKGKYLVDINVGYNGSENFAPGKYRFGLFPSFSLGWIMSEENFMKKQDVIKYLKFRVSWGRVGNDRGISTRFMYMPDVWGGGGNYNFGIDNENNEPGAQLSAPGNREVTWETADKQNYGFDIKLFDQDKLSLSFDYFFEHRTGILISPNSTPGIIATPLPNLNLGKVNNQGFEVQASWNDTVGKEFNYFVTFNTSFARNKIIFMDEVKKQEEYMHETGGSTGRFKGMYQFERLYQYSDFTTGENGELILNPDLPQPYQQVYPGDAMYSDLNHDNIVDGNDKMVTGFSQNPEYIFGLNLGFDWKGFNFSAQFTGATNVNRIYSIEHRIPYTNAGKRGLLKYFYDGCWTVENQENATYPRASEVSEAWNSENSTLWLKDASYFRLKSLNLGYTFRNAAWFKHVGLNSIQLTFSGYNLLTFSKLKHMDPESQPDKFGQYPLIKVYNFGVKLNF